MTTTLARFKDDQRARGERLTVYWVLGREGAASTWFSDPRPILDHAVSPGVGWHSPRPFDGGTDHGPCPYLESPCFSALGSAMGLGHLTDAFERDDDEYIYEWLQRQYAEAPWRPS